MKLIIFDMDGTLIDSGDVITNTINYVRKYIGLDAIDKTTMLTQLNNPDINSAEYFYGTKEFTPEQTKVFGEYYDKNCTKDIKLYDGIKELLEQLKKENYTLTVATNASSKFAKKMLKATQIEQYFSYIVGHDMVTNPKPNPEMLLHIVQHLHSNIDNTILVGDSKKDLQSANNANITFIPVNWGFTKHQNGIDNTKQLYDKITQLDLG